MKKISIPKIILDSKGVSIYRIKPLHHSTFATPSEGLLLSTTVSLTNLVKLAKFP